MLNREKYAKEIIDIAARSSLAIQNNKPVACADVQCNKCECYNEDAACYLYKSEWLEREYVEPPVDWSKVPVDTPILVRQRNTDEWVRRYFAKYEKDMVYAYRDGATSWSIGNSTNVCDWEYAKLAENDDVEAENPQTNADRIRSMTDEELLDFLRSIETYEEGSAMTIEDSAVMCSVADVEQWLKAESEGADA